MTDTAPTGIGPLDRKIGSGIPAGHSVLLTAPPASQSELILSSIAGENETLYLTTERSTASVERTLDRGRSTTGDVVVRAIDTAEPLTSLYNLLGTRQLPPVVVIDRIDTVERRDVDRVRAFLETLQEQARTTDTVVVMHGSDTEESSTQRTVTQYIADVVFELREAFDGNTMKTHLFVPKFRGGRALKEPLSLELTGRIVVDTSRDIA